MQNTHDLAAKESWLFIVNTLTVGGSEKKTVMAANNLAARGYNVHLVYLNSPDDLASQVSERVILYKLERTSRLDWKAIRKLRIYIKEKKFNIIWCVNSYSMLYGFLASLNIRHNKRIIVSLNTTYFTQLRDALFMILYVPILHRVDRIVFGCAIQMNHWLRLYRLSKKKSLVIYNGIDTDYYQSRSIQITRDEVRGRYGVENDDVVIGMVARLMPEKCHATAITAIKFLIENGCKVKLMLAGDGLERESLESLVKRLNLENSVLFLGDIADVREVLIAFDVFLLTSNTETFSNAALEAMSMSIPVVLSNVGGASEMVDIGKNGYLFESGNTKELISILIKMMNAEVREKMSSYARKKVCSEYSFDRMVNDYINT